MKNRILIADDEPIILEILEDFLRSEGFNVTTCIDGGEALLRIQKDAPDLVMLDLMMDGVDGMEALRQLKGSENTEHLPVIFLTAVDVKGNFGRECLDAGAFAVIEKPVDFDELKEVVDCAIPLMSASAINAGASSRLNVLSTLGLTKEKINELLGIDDDHVPGDCDDEKFLTVSQDG